MSYDQTDELCALSIPSDRISFLSFVTEVVNVLGEEYLRSTTEIDLQRILKISTSLEFTGYLGPWDCQHYPVAWAGKYIRKEKTHSGSQRHFEL